MQLLAGDLVQQLLRPQQVLHQTDGVAVAEVREVRDDGEVLVRAPVVVQDDVVSDDDPADAPHELADDLEAVVLDEVGDLLAGEVLGHRAGVAGLGCEEELLAVELAELALHNPDVAHHVALVEPDAVGGCAGVAKAVPVHLDAVVAVREGAVVAVAQQLSVGLVVEHRDVVGCDPLRGEHLAPLVWIVLIRVGVDQDILAVDVVDADFALVVVAVVQAHVQEAPGADDAVGKHVGALPVELVVVADLLEDLRQDVGHRRGGPGARTEADLGPVVDLLTQHVADGGQDLVDGEHRAAVALELGPVASSPLVASKEALALVGFFDVFGVAVVTDPRVAGPGLVGQLGVNGHR